MFVKRNILSWLKHTECELVIYHEGKQPPVEHPRLVWRQWEDIPGAVEFHEEAKKFPPACGRFVSGYSYHYDVDKFARKVWAQCDAAQEQTDYLIWLDSDVEITRDINRGVIEEAINGMPLATYVRPGYHCESGVVIWDMQMPATLKFFLAYLNLYKSRNIYKLQYGWHDCWALDYVCQAIQLPVQNLGKGGDFTSPHYQQLDVIPGSYLGNFLRHDKGAKKYAA
jgi:hypothetical protein